MDDSRLFSVDDGTMLLLARDVDDVAIFVLLILAVPEVLGLETVVVLTTMLVLPTVAVVDVVPADIPVVTDTEDAVKLVIELLGRL